MKPIRRLHLSPGMRVALVASRLSIPVFSAILGTSAARSLWGWCLLWFTGAMPACLANYLSERKGTAEPPEH